MSEDKKPYSIGYRKPPEDSRFKAGQSGNPKGRPKGSRNLATEIEAEMNARVPITENGKKKKVSQRKIIAKQLVRKAAQGDPKAIPIIMNHDLRIQHAKTTAEATEPEKISAEDQLVMQSIIDRIRRPSEAPEKRKG